MPQPKKPTALKELQGTARRDRANPREVRPVAKLPSPPSGLDRDAVREWKRAGKILEGLGLVTEADRPVFAAYCQSYARWVQSGREIEKLQKSDDPNASYLATWYGIERKARVEMVKWASHFGMSPSTRSGVSAAERQRSVSKLEVFRNRRRGGGEPS